MILERQEEERAVHIALSERRTRAVMGMVAGAAGWKDGVQDAWAFELVPTGDSQVDNLPDLDTVMGMFGDSAEFDANDIPGLAEFFAGEDAA